MFFLQVWRIIYTSSLVSFQVKELEYENQDSEGRIPSPVLTLRLLHRIPAAHRLQFQSVVFISGREMEQLGHILAGGGEEDMPGVTVGGKKGFAFSVWVY